MAGPQEVLAGAGWGNLSLDQEPSARPSTSSRPASVASGRAAPVTPASQKPDCSRWNCIYPAYIDKKKSSKQGRRVIASLAAENPQAYEIADCCVHFKLPTVLEVRILFLYFLTWTRSAVLFVNSSLGLAVDRIDADMCS
jgi:hypothetical protein